MWGNGDRYIRHMARINLIQVKGQAMRGAALTCVTHADHG
jgi:hypothetical protein